MKAFQLALVSTAFAFASLGASAAWAADTHVMVMPADLKWADVPSLPPGAKIAVIEGPMNEAVPFTVRLKLPADYKVPAHWHPAIEHVTVISGTFNMGTGDKLDQSKTTPLSAGSVAIMQPKTNHCAFHERSHDNSGHGVAKTMALRSTMSTRQRMTL